MGNKTAPLTQDRLKEILNYDQETGKLTWRIEHISKRGMKIVRAGDAAGSKRLGYLALRIDGTLYSAHRLIWLWMTGSWPNGDVDHIDRSGLNNSWNNLRDVTHAVNGQNQSAKRKNGSGYLGASFNKRRGKWMSYINLDGNRTYLGAAFETEDEAHAAYLRAKRELHAGCTI